MNAENLPLPLKPRALISTLSEIDKGGKAQSHGRYLFGKGCLKKMRKSLSCWNKYVIKA
jgi:hypothetical protein